MYVIVYVMYVMYATVIGSSFIAEYHSIAWIYNNLFIHSLIDRH